MRTLNPNEYPPTDATIEELKAMIVAGESDLRRAKETVQRLAACHEEYELAKAVVEHYESIHCTPWRKARVELGVKLMQRELGEE